MLHEEREKKSEAKKVVNQSKKKGGEKREKKCGEKTRNLMMFLFFPELIDTHFVQTNSISFPLLHNWLTKLQ